MTPRRYFWIFAAIFWLAFGLISGIQVWISMITHGHSVPVLLSYYLLIWIAWLGFTAVIAWLNRRFPLVPFSRLHLLVHLLASCVIAVLHGFYWLGLLIWIRPFDPMDSEVSSLKMGTILFYRMPLEWLLYCLVLGGALAFDYYERFRDRERETARLRSSLVDARLHALELQIQPHFLFNTLNAISSLVRTKRNDEAVRMMTGLGEILRYTLDHEGRQFVPLETELAVLRKFLEIQHARFPDRMTFSIDAASDTLRARIPTFLLQPLAENAVRHGIAMSAAGGVVRIEARRVDDTLQLTVFNSGSLVKDAPRGIGLRNTVERLEHLYGTAWRFEIGEVTGGVDVSLTLPWEVVP